MTSLPDSEAVALRLHLFEDLGHLIRFNVSTGRPFLVSEHPIVEPIDNTYYYLSVHAGNYQPYQAKRLFRYMDSQSAWSSSPLTNNERIVYPGFGTLNFLTSGRRCF